MARRLTLAPVLRSRGRMLVVLAAAVVAVHAWLVDHVADAVAAWSADAAMPPRLQVAYVRELSPEAPAAVAARPPDKAPTPAAEPPPRPRPLLPDNATAAAPGPAPAASEPVPADAGEPLLPPAAAPLDQAEAPTATADAASAATATSAAAPPLPQPVPDPLAQEPMASASQPVSGEAPGPSSALPFRWPASTRLSYRLTGQYRGEVNGSAQVEWILAAPRYQVNLDVTVGLPFAPLFTRRMRSDGHLSASGLHPERYEEDSKLAFRDRRRVSLRLDADGVLLANGQRWSRPPSTGTADTLDATVQDSASQFVQLSYLFTTQPQRLTPGQVIGFPLALPRRVEPWVYEVVGAQTLYTPFGALETFHVRPRRDTPRGNDLLAEAWFSPQLAYLPVRIRIEQDTDTYIDLMIDRKPELGAAPLADDRPMPK